MQSRQQTKKTLGEILLAFYYACFVCMTLAMQHALIHSFRFHGCCSVFHVSLSSLFVVRYAISTAIFAQNMKLCNGASLIARTNRSWVWKWPMRVVCRISVRLNIQFVLTNKVFVLLDQSSSGRALLFAGQSSGTESLFVSVLIEFSRYTNAYSYSYIAPAERQPSDGSVLWTL